MLSVNFLCLRLFQFQETLYVFKKENFNKGKLFTGDLAKRDEDGFYYITGRKNRYLKMFGLRINLDEVEQQIKNQNIDSVIVIKVNDDKIIKIQHISNNIIK